MSFRSHLGFVLLLAIVGLWAYRNSFTTPFLFDDETHIVEEPTIRRLWPIGPVVSGKGRPVVFLTLAANYAWGGLDVRGYHVVNLAIHLAAGLVLFGLVRRTLTPPGATTSPRDAWIAFATALLWTVHPLQTESVTYVIQRSESLMGLCFFLALYGLLRGVRDGRGWFAVTIAACWLGIGSKEVMAVAPLVLLLFDRIFLAPSWRDVSRRWPMHAACWASLAGLAVILKNVHLQIERPTAGLGVRVTPWEYLSSQAGVIVYYLRLSFWPDPLCLDYKWPVARDWRAIVLPGFVVVGLLGASFLALRRWPRLGFLGLTFFLVLAPTSSLMPIADLAFEHRMYVSLAPLCLLVVLAGRAIVDRLPATDDARRLMANGFLAVATILLVLRTVDRNRDYRDPAGMWADVLATAPHNSRAHFNLGRELHVRGEKDRAREHYAQAATLGLRHENLLINLAVLEAEQDRLDDAKRHYEQALQLNPRSAIGHSNYGELLARQGDLPRAVEQYREALRLAPRHVPTFVRLARARHAQGESDARDLLREALALDPSSAEALAFQAEMSGSVN